MPVFDRLDTLYILFAFLVQIFLIIHFAMRRRSLERAIRNGPLVYALGIPALLLSIAQVMAGKPWYFWLAGVLFSIFCLFGYIVEYVLRINWRQPAIWSVFVPYVALYLGAICFYWWPLARLDRRLWFAYTILFLVSTAFNVISHKTEARAKEQTRLL